MPRSIQQLKHRRIFFNAISAERMAIAVQILEHLPGVSAAADVRQQCISVDYWVDEYTLTELEQRLSERGFPLFGGNRFRILRAEIQRDEERERDNMGARVSHCGSGGVFAQMYRPCYDECVDDFPHLFGA
ncbi:MAG: hypothetical protein P4L87_16490 [Formivibrio sp.]|nr:hypothetical protein [Formivibrio sp.]